MLTLHSFEGPSQQAISVLLANMTSLDSEKISTKVEKVALTFAP